MANEKASTPSAVSRFIIRDKFPEKEFSKADKHRVAVQISIQLNRTAAKPDS